MNGGFEVCLIISRDLFGINILPLKLVAHSAAGKDRHGKFSAAKSAIFHEQKLRQLKLFLQRGEKKILLGGKRADRLPFPVFAEVFLIEESLARTLRPFGV